MVTRVLSNRDSEIKGAIGRIKKTNAILKSHVNKLFPTEFKHIMTLTKQKVNGTKVKLRSSRNWWTKERILMLTSWTLGGRRSLWTLQIFNKTRGIFPSVTRVLSILLTTTATSASVERVKSKRVNTLLLVCIHRDIFLDYDNNWYLCIQMSKEDAFR